MMSEVIFFSFTRSVCGLAVIIQVSRWSTSNNLLRLKVWVSRVTVCLISVLKHFGHLLVGLYRTYRELYRTELGAVISWGPRWPQQHKEGISLLWVPHHGTNIFVQIKRTMQRGTSTFKAIKHRVKVFTGTYNSCNQTVTNKANVF